MRVVRHPPFLVPFPLSFLDTFNGTTQFRGKLFVSRGEIDGVEIVRRIRAMSEEVCRCVGKNREIAETENKVFEEGTNSE